MRNDDLLTVEQASCIGLPVVYGFHDDGGLFYVGKTTDPRGRFRTHLHDRRANLHLRRRIKEAGVNLRVEIIRLAPSDLARAEKDAILANAAKLVNKLDNPFRGEVYFEIPHADGPLADCPICDQPITQRSSKYCSKCLDKIVRPQGMTKDELRHLAAQAVAQHAEKTQSP